MYNFDVLPDIKLIKIFDSTQTAVATTTTASFSFASQAQKLGVLMSVQFSSTQATLESLANSLVVDDEDLDIAAGIQTTAASQRLYLLGNFNYPRIMNTAGNPAHPMNFGIPFRRVITTAVKNSNAAAADITCRMWALLHNDDEQNFQVVSSK